MTFTGHNVDIMAGTITLASRSLTTLTTHPTSSPATATISFDSGTINANGIVMAVNANGDTSAATSMSATINVGGIGTSPITTALLTVGAGGIDLGNINTNAGANTFNF